MAMRKADVLTSTLDMKRGEWLEHRRKGIGGSDIAGILGLSKWSSPMKVYQDKIGELPEIEESEVMYWGNVLEDVVAKEFQKRSGFRVRRRNAILVHPKYKFMYANVDRLVVGKREGLECKTTNEYLKKEWVDGEEVPEQYYLQCQWYMAITGYKKWHIAVLIGGNKFHMDVIKRDDELIEMMIERAREFWVNHVLPKDPPPFDGSDASDELLKYLYPESEENTEIHLSNDYSDDITRYVDLKTEEKEIKSEMKEIENRIKGEMETYERALVGDNTITWKSFTTNRFDSKRFKVEQPELYEKYINESVSRRFSVK